MTCFLSDRKLRTLLNKTLRRMCTRAESKSGPARDFGSRPGEEKERGRYRGWDRTGIIDKGENRTDTTGKGWSKTGITDRGWSKTGITDREGRRCWHAGDGRCADSL